MLYSLTISPYKYPTEPAIPFISAEFKETFHCGSNRMFSFDVSFILDVSTLANAESTLKKIVHKKARRT